MSEIFLTQTVQKGGCAAKVPAAELRKILAKVRFPKSHDNLLIDGRYFDDAAVYKINRETALVETIDFFTPIVDTPYKFGKVAAANALSDVYAMGAKPITAMAVLAFPLASFSSEVIEEVLQGASDTVGEAKACFVGGHSIDDDTLKFGLSVTGLVHPERIWSNRGARIGDQLILTKPLGTGTLTAALKRKETDEEGIKEALDSMMRLNNIIDYLSESELGAIHAATDVTGFGLTGHSMQMALASEKKLSIEFARLPVMQRAKEFIEAGFLTKAHRTNKEYTSGKVHIATGDLAGGLLPWQELIIHDPQTSGGLLLSVSAATAEQIVESLKTAFPGTAIIGEVLEGPTGVNVIGSTSTVGISTDVEVGVHS